MHNTYRLPGGEDAIAECDAQLLRDAGHVVEQLWAGNPEKPIQTAGSLALAVHNPIAAARVRRVVRDFRPDVAHVQNTWFALTGAAVDALHAEGVPVVMTLQNYRLLCVNAELFRDGHVCFDCVGTHPWRGVVHRCYRSSATESAIAAAAIAVARARHTWDRVARMLVPSEVVRDVFIGAGFPEAQLTVRPNVVADPGPRSIPPSRSRRVVYAGRLSVEKGVDVLLEAWRRAEFGSSEIGLTIVGDGPLRARLASSAPPGVEFTGWLPAHELTTLLLESRALVFPSQWVENFGRVILEAMAAGVPVLASDIGTPAVTLAPLGPDWLVPPSDTPAWARALERLSDDDLVDAGGLAARGEYERRYTLDRGLRDLLDVYAAVTAGVTT